MLRVHASAVGLLVPEDIICSVYSVLIDKMYLLLKFKVA